MAEAQLRAELAVTKVELQPLKERISVGTPTVHEDLSLISLIPKWSGSETGIPLHEFLSSIESSGRMGLWQDADKLEITNLRLNYIAKQFYNGCLELHAPGVMAKVQRRVFDTGFETPTPFIPLHEATNSQAV